MPTLHEVQAAIGRHMLGHTAPGVAGFVVGDGLDPDARLAIYRNTFVAVLTNALRLTYPAVERLVGPEFFDGAAALFVEATPPRSPYLNDYGATFADFLADFSPAGSIPYLADVARLEWAVAGSLNAPDAETLDIPSFAAAAEHESLCVAPHPAVRLLRLAYPADTIWRAVLGQDEEGMAAIDLADGPVWLLIERNAAGSDVARLSEAAWRFLNDLCIGRPVHDALADAAMPDVADQLARHLAADRFSTAGVVAFVSSNSQESRP